VGSFLSRSLSALHRLLIHHPRYCHDLEVFVESMELPPVSLHTPDSDIARRGAGRGVRTVVLLFILKIRPFKTPLRPRFFWQIYGGGTVVFRGV
jgi:hypothetical protein